MKKFHKKYKSAILLSFVGLLFSACNHYEVGDYYHKGDLSGVIITLNEEGMPSLLLSLGEAKDLNADSALAWSANYDDGSWRLPDKREMTLINNYKSLLNATLQRKEAPQLFGSNTYYWTSTPCSESHTYACGPMGVKCYFRSNHSPLYRARAVRSIDN